MGNKLKPKKITKFIYYGLILLAALLTIVRWMSAFDYNIVVISTEINSHISNFSLSLLVYLGVGFTWILQGNQFKNIILLGIFIVVANILCETVMGGMNTADILDAVYGIIGTIISFCFLFVTNKYGFEITHDED